MARNADVCVVGGGISGMSAASFLLRAGIDTVVVDVGRSLALQADLHNVPGLGHVPGPDFIARLRTQLQTDTMINGKALDIRRTNDGYRVITKDQEIDSTFVILAIGSFPFKFSGLSLTPLEGRQPFVRWNIAVDRDHESPTHSNLYVVGVLSGVPSQAVICAATGAIAAVSIASKIKGEFWVDHDDLEPEK